MVSYSQASKLTYYRVRDAGRTPKEPDPKD